MTISITHPFVSAKGDGGDATLVRPSNWNANHTTSMATGKFLGRLTAGVGSFEELDISAYFASLMNAADKDELGGLLGLFETGDVKYTFKTAASDGWLLLVGGTAQVNTIGNASSGASLRANADTEDLFTLIWNACSNSLAPVYSGGSASTRGASAAADYAANKTIAIPNPVGKSPVGAGAANTVGTTTSARTLGAQGGTETHTLVTANLPAYTPAGTVATSISHNAAANVGNIDPGGGTSVFIAQASHAATITATSTFTGTPQGGTSTAVDHMNPFIALNAMVKL